MKAIVSHSDLRRAMDLAASVVLKKTTIPILEFVRLEFSRDQVMLRATDLDMEISLPIEAVVEGKGVVMIRAATLAGFAKVARHAVTIEVIGVKDRDSSDTIEISDGGITARVRSTVPPVDYPDLTSPTQEALRGSRKRWEMTQGDLARILRLTRHCISAEETRYYLNGVFLTAKPGDTTLRAVATDGHRMAVADSDVRCVFDGELKAARADTAAKDGLKNRPGPRWDGAIVPTRVAALLGKLVARPGNEPVRFHTNGTRLMVDIGDIRVAGKCIDGVFPDYTRVVPPRSEVLRIDLNAPALASVCGVANAMGRWEAKALSFDVASGTMTAKIANDGEVVMDATVSSAGPQPPFGFNLEYLFAQSKVTPVFSMTGQGPGDPFMVEGEDPDAFWVMMPMRV
jgi:DNA polymerase III subunit beta